MQKIEEFPDGTIVDDWFYDATTKDLDGLGKPYVITDFGVKDDGKVYTKEIQNVIDKVAENGGGVVIVPKGTYYSGSLFLKSGVNFYVCKDGMLKGSDDICDYALCDTRIEGESCKYFAALLNVENMHDIVIGGAGIIDGNGLRFWNAFWKRLEWNPQATNKDEQRPRLLFVSNCSHITIYGLKLQNSCFWTAHIYKSHHVKLLGCSIQVTYQDAKAPSTDAIDIDVCHDVLIKNCYINVSDDGVALKGGKGPWADELPENGSNERIIMEDCYVHKAHSPITCGSESIHNRNILVRRIKVGWVCHILCMKMRPDTPQHYEYIQIENVTGEVGKIITVNPWTQFFNLKGRTDMPISKVEHITVKNCEVEAWEFLNIKGSDKYELRNFTLENLFLKAKGQDIVNTIKDGVVENIQIKNVEIV